jgi:UDP-N-acetylglucosamine:LPS N-acetylglucosamine transferase
MSARRKRVLAISSGGGHWVQLLRLRPAFAECDVTFATVRSGYRRDVGEDASFAVIPDCNRAKKLKAIRSACSIFLLLLKLRPDVVVSTGAAPGYFAIRFARWLGARTIWVDSVANAEELSMSGQMAGKHASLCLTQWAHLARANGPAFFGSVL